MPDIKLPYSVIVGGHVCLDIIPTVQGGGFQMIPGKLVDVGQAVISTGGAVANTGIALHRLGMPVRLMGKVGNDIFGEAVLAVFRKEGEGLADGMIVAEGEPTSYSIVISPPGIDRMFLHCTGANDTFHSSDVEMEALEDAGLFHFGYPPLMRQMYVDDGAELIRLMRKVKEAGLTTSLDLAKPDPDSAAGQVNWKAILTAVLPDVDLFHPSIEEILYMLRRERYEAMLQQYGSERLIEHVDGELLEELSSELLRMGAAIVVLKLGEHGLYMRTTANAARLAETGRYSPQLQNNWLNRELYIPCFQVEVAGTTGAGDCTIAGFLAGFVQGLTPEETIIGAVGAGACNVERPDATSGIQAWQSVQGRIAAGWAQHRPKPYLGGFQTDVYSDTMIYSGPKDQVLTVDEKVEL
ncbi:carbohydrate kinase family protein [Paenibacillus sp. NPDC058071]|uniref:carbohydrate kinase family protein n=1 Tax=Paenibacillus sp. NPDC058071 TaxID=3346326 RepID=UPI0036DB478A